MGSGTLLTFPVLLALGYPPVTANVSNTVGLVPGNLSGVLGYRRELAGQRGRVLLLGTGTVLGALLGAVLLLTLPPGAFKAIVPALIIVALVLVVVQPRLSRWVRERRAADGLATDPTGHGVLLWLAVAATGVYGGYFGAAQGVLLMGLLGVVVHEDLQRLNAVKNVLALLANTVSAAVFIAVAHVSWQAAGLIAVGSIIGGQLGARLGRRLSPTVLRTLIVVVGVVAVARLLLT